MLAIVDRNFIFPQKILCQTKSYYYQNILDFISTKAIDDDHTPHGLEILSVLGCNTDLKTSIMAIDSQSDRSLSTRMLGVLWAAGLSKKDLIKNIKPNPHPAKVINASFGFLFSDLKNPPFGPVLDTISALNDHNAILVCSAGNESTLADNRLPGSLAGVISVGASNKNQQSAYFSNFGKSVDILAPGEDILGFSKNLEPIMLDGTSFAAPITASIISLLVSINPNFSWKHVEYLLKNSAKTISCADYCPSTMPINSQKLCQKTCCDKNNNNICDLGIINAYNALSLAKKELFNKVLLDVDDYFLPLDPSNNFSKTISVKNWGFSSGLVKFYTKEPFIYAYPDEFYINAAKDFNSPAIQKVTLYSATPEFAKKFTIKFISKNDNIEAMVSLDPL